MAKVSSRSSDDVYDVRPRMARLKRKDLNLDFILFARYEVAEEIL